MKARNLFRPLMVPAVWLALITLITLAFTTWWWSIVEPTVNYRLAWSQFWQLFVGIALIGLVVKIIPNAEESYITIHKWVLLFAMFLFWVAGTLLVSWVVNVWPVLSGFYAFNLAKALASLGFAMASGLLIGLTLYRVYQDNKQVVVAPK